MRFDHDTLAYLQFALPRKHPVLFEALHRVVQEELDDLKHAGQFPRNVDLYRVLLDGDVRLTQDIRKRTKDLRTLHQHLHQIVDGVHSEATIAY